jgi:mono/diheme cytochrome c family protein
LMRMIFSLEEAIGMKREVAFVACVTLIATFSGAEAAEKSLTGAPGTAGSGPANEDGERLFLGNCAACHGGDAKGHGPKAGTTKPPPADLTVLSAQNGGVFPAAKVADVIRNGGRVLGHGSHDMPAWGRHFSVRRHPEVARARIDALVEYIRSRQVP